MFTTWMRRAHRDERGVIVSAWAVLMIGVMLLLVGIAVDLAGQLAATRQAAEVAGQAARTAAQQVSTDTYMANGKTVEVTASRAKSAATQFITASGLTGTAHIADGTLVVEATAVYHTRFLSIIGIGEIPATGTATARIVRVLNGEEHP